MRLAFLLAALPFFAYAHDDYPTEKTINELLSQSGEHIAFFSHDKTKIFTVYLKSHEKAYLISVALRDKGRNDMFRTALIRPAINEARLLPSAVKRVDAIYDMNEDKVSEIVAAEIYSGQGTSQGTQSLVHLDGWVPEVLLERKSRNNSGMYVVRNAQYYNVQCSWDFGTPDDSEEIELRETCRDEQGATSAKDQTTKTAYRLIDGALKAVPWQLREWEKPRS